MAKIKKLPSGSYNSVVYAGKDADGKRLYKSFTADTRADVQILIADWMKEKDSQSGKNITVEAAMRAYIDSKRNILSPTTVRGYQTILNNSFKGIQSKRIFDLTAREIQAAVDIEAQDHTPKSVRNMYGLLSSTLKQYRPSFRPAILLPKKTKSEIRIPSEEEIKALIEAARNTEIELPLLLGACCGMRRSEICGLKWSHINFEKNTLRISEALVRDSEGNLVEKGTKTTAGTRTIQMLPPVAEALARYRNLAEAEHVTSLKPWILYDRYLALQKKCDIAPPYRFHDLRHYFVSVCIALNIPKKYIAHYVGHETEHMIDAVYAHIMEEKKSEMEDALAAYFAKLV